MSRKRKAGQGLVEWSLVTALVAVAAILALTLLGNTAYQVYSNVVCDVQGADPAVFPESPCAHLTNVTPLPSPTPTNPGGYPAVVKADAPSAYWRLDETGVANGSVAKDEIPTDGSAGPNGHDPGTYNTNSGTITSGISPSAIVVGSSGAVKGTAVSLAGGADMSVPTDATHLTALHGDNTRTVEVWFNSARTANVQSQYQNIFETGAVGSYDSFDITLNTNTVEGAGLEISFIGNYRPDFAPVLGDVYIPDMNLADSHWHYLVVTLSGSTLNVYVDGVQPAGTADGTNNIVNQGPPTSVAGTGFLLPFVPNTTTSAMDFGGATLGLGGAPWVGMLDEAAVYNFALSPLQVATHYAYGVGTPATVATTPYSVATADGDSQNGCPLTRVSAGTCGPVAYWRLGETVNSIPGPASVAADAAAGSSNDPNGNPGNYSGGGAYGGGSGIPVGTYAQSGNSGTGAAATSTTLDAGSSALSVATNGSTAAALNVNGAGVRANPVSALVGGNARSIKLWFEAPLATTFTTLGTNNPGTVSNVADIMTLLATGSDGFAIDVMSQAGANYNLADIGGAAAGTHGGIEVRFSHVNRVYVPAAADLRDGQWHYLVVTLSGTNVQVFLDNTQASGYVCCYSNAWSSIYTAPNPMVLSAAPSYPAGNITLGYEESASPVNGWFKGQLQDVALFSYVLSAQQISHEWGQAHPAATCSNLVLASISGNANGGTLGNTDGPVSATATQTCDAGADPYVAFYYGMERYGVPPVAGPACYSNTSASSQVPWITSSGPWVYCYPGGYPSASASAQQTFPYTVAKAVGSSPVTITFYQGQTLTPCTVVYNAQPGPLYFIEAQNGYSGASPATPTSGLALNSTQAASGGLNHTLATSQSGTAYSPAWGVTGPSAANCLPAPVSGTSSSGAITSNSTLGGESTPDGYAPWVQLQDPFILLTPASASTSTSTPQAFSATAYAANGVAAGNVSGSTVLTITGTGTCNNTTHTCQAGSAGTYTVTGTYGSEQAQATLNVSALGPYTLAVLADSPVAYWHLGEASGAGSAVDASANANTGTYSVNTMPGTTGLLLNNANTAASFDGTAADYVSVASSASLNTSSAISIEAWIKPTDVSNYHPIIEYNNGTGTGPGGNPWGVHFWTEPSGGLGANFIDTSGNNRTVLTGNAVIAVGGTYHVVATYGVVASGDASSNCPVGVYCGRVYSDGVLQADINLGSFTLQTSYGLRLGNRASGGGSSSYFFGGTEDEVAIYGSALTHAQVSAHYAASGRSYTTMSQVQSPQGTWVGTYGTTGYDLLNWNNGNNSVISLPAGVSVSQDATQQYCWATAYAIGGDVRGLENAAGTQMAGCTLYNDPSPMVMRLHFTNAYSGTVHVYAVDWDSFGPRQNTVTIDDGSSVGTADLTAFVNGAWLSLPVNVAAGGTVTIMVIALNGHHSNVLSGILLD